ncbi:MAG: nitroreductase family protein [Terracidiphilus sp.]
MPSISVDTAACTKDGFCVDVCPSRFLTRTAEGYPAQAANRQCIVCGHCVAVCPTGALVHSEIPADALRPVPRDLPSAAQIDALLVSRRSVRLFHDRPLPRATLEELLDVARRAPTAVNSQLVHWTVVNDSEKVHALAQQIVQWTAASNPSSPMVEEWRRGYDWALRAAPTVVVASAPASYDWGAPDCAIALTYLELAAAARSLGVCWAGYLTRIAAIHPPLRQMLTIPTDHVVHGALMLGERRVHYRSIPPRKPLSVQWL